MRLAKLAPEDMTPRQREVYERIAGKRGRFGAPYRIWIRSPELCDRAERMSSYMRWECSLPNKLRELSILVTARFWDAQYSWNAHVDQTAGGRCHRRETQAVLEAEDERVSYQFSMEMLEDHFVSDETFEPRQPTRNFTAEPRERPRRCLRGRHAGRPSAGCRRAA